jgi:predicted ester cyclase
MTSMVESGRRVVEAFNANAPDEVADLVAEGFVDHHIPPELPPGLEGLRVWWGILHDAFDCRLEIDDVVVGKERLAMRMTFSGVHTGEFQGHPATNRPFSGMFMSVERFEDGRLVERWEVGDVAGIFGQLGLLG